MIVLNETVSQQKIFEAVRSIVRNMHPDMGFEEDPCGAPLLFKSTDATVWVRVFYQGMEDVDPDEPKRELAKLTVLMPKEASVYFFYPSLDANQMSGIRSVNHRLSFFEYGGAAGTHAEKAGTLVRKWIPASENCQASVVIQPPAHRKERSVAFLNYSRLTSDEVAGLAELGLSLKRI